MYPEVVSKDLILQLKALCTFYRQILPRIQQSQDAISLLRDQSPASLNLSAAGFRIVAVEGMPKCAARSQMLSNGNDTGANTLPVSSPRCTLPSSKLNSG